MKPCIKCGGTERYSSRGRAIGECKACAKAGTVKWRTANPEKEKSRHIKWAADNPEKRKVIVKKYNENNVEKNKERGAKYRAANKEKLKNKCAKWYSENTEHAKIYAAKWKSENLEKWKIYMARWLKENPEYIVIREQNRRARKIANGGKLSKGIRDKLFNLQRGKCACGCGQDLGDNFHLDHIMPLALGGANEDWNMQLLTAKCNLQKHAKHPIDFMQSRGFLI